MITLWEVKKMKHYLSNLELNFVIAT